MKESEELKSSRAAYLEKLKKYGAISMPASAHYTAGYNDGSAILHDVADLCEEAERQLIEVTKQRDELLAELDKLIDVVANIGMISGIYDDEQAALEHAAKALARVKESK